MSIARPPLSFHAVAAGRIKVGEVNLIDGGDGKTLPAYAASYPATMGALLDPVTKTLGIDIATVISGTQNGVGQHGDRS